MNTRTFKRRFAFLSIVITLSCTLFVSPEIKSASESTPKLVFPVISDIHIGGVGADKKFEDALKDYRSIYPKYDFIAMVGDITDLGRETQYHAFRKILNSNKVDSATEIILMGNHEYMAEDSTDRGYEERFVKETEVPSLYYDLWIKGYHFIALAPESRDVANLSKGQLNWLKTKLREESDEHKPIFVFLHHPLTNTVSGSGSCGGVKNDRKLYGILNKYPQVILFTGHSHYILDNINTMYRKAFTMFNTGAVYYTMRDGDKYCDPKLSEGLLVEVYEKNVVVKCREFSKHQWIGYTYNIKY